MAFTGSFDSMHASALLWQLQGPAAHDLASPARLLDMLSQCEQVDRCSEDCNILVISPKSQLIHSTVDPYGTIHIGSAVSTVLKGLPNLGRSSLYLSWRNEVAEALDCPGKSFQTKMGQPRMHAEVQHLQA